VKWEVGEEGLGEFGGQVERGQPRVSRLEVKLGGDTELDGERLEREGIGQGGPNNRMGVRGCLLGWKGNN
jgi:hypothetical protein